MKALLIVTGLMLSVPALGQISLLEIAEDVRDERGLEKLVSASIGGGRHYEVKGSSFHVVDLMPTSGILSAELFVFESFNGQLALRVHIPHQPFVVMRAEAHGGTLTISEKSQHEGEWKVRLHVFPTAAADRSAAIHAEEKGWLRADQRSELRAICSSALAIGATLESDVLPLAESLIRRHDAP